jgi:hypothetical protein
MLIQLIITLFITLEPWSLGAFESSSVKNHAANFLLAIKTNKTKVACGRYPPR